MRFNDWQSKFQAFLRDRQHREFEWGSNDCVLFACDSTLIVTGVDHGAGFRSHNSALEAMRIVESLGGLDKMVDNALGEQINPNLAQVADVGLCDIDHRPSLVVCGGDHWIGPGVDGVVRIQPYMVSRAWRVR